MFQAHLQRRFGDFLGDRDRGRARSSPIRCPCSWPSGWPAPRAALLGDAAHGVHPIAGQGLNLGLKGAAALAEVLVDAARLGEDIGAEAVLERYARWRRFDNVMLAAGHRRLRPAVLQRQPGRCAWRAAWAWRRSTASRPARRFFMQEAGGAVGDLPRLLRGEAL